MKPIGYIALLSAIACTACGPTYVATVPKLPLAPVPAECKVGSRPWSELQGEVSKQDLARLWAQNRQAYNDLRYRHAICRKSRLQLAEKG